MNNRVDLTEHELLTLLKGKDIAAFDQIFEKFYRPLCFFASRIIHDTVDAQDLVQDVFVKFWQKENMPCTADAIRSYLYVGVKNTCFNYLEKNSVKIAHRQTLVNTDIEEATILNNIIHAEVLRQVFAAVDTLPEQCRKIIRMTFEDGKKAKEIACELGITISTVNNQKMRGLSLLKNRLSDEGLALGMLLILPGIMDHVK
ncbi:RNA polymerase sigma-70 factor (ECF subfamily) [Mucilaginibacter sp. SG538B]|uniref:RNA polymerase sigma-70 factor n=1 Tax=Mucilaginibacter sp. SG538B TaxID=2587021 RepID=UPI00159D7BC5|nr:RNA polymerase sigma-70 factor [Mucilaginibacter sp. SG538B]NVM66982.1 RNA polymerase sigma-70 factor (ECF subfamily) [Mucilaginibacter sp. SG538B]